MFRIGSTTLGGALMMLDSSGATREVRSERARLIAPHEMAWFDRQTPARQKVLLVNLRRAETCIATLAKREGGSEARAAVKLPNPRFYTGISDGVVVYAFVPGLDGCPLPLAEQDRKRFYRALPETYSGPVFGLDIQQSCGAAATRYAAQFNRTLAALRPEILDAACAAGRQ